MTQFTINYPNGYMTLNLEKAFEVNEKGNLTRIYKKDFYKIMALVKDNCSIEQKEFLHKWLTNNSPALASEYTKTFSRIKRGK